MLNPVKKHTRCVYKKPTDARVEFCASIISDISVPYIDETATSRAIDFNSLLLTRTAVVIDLISFTTMPISTFTRHVNAENITRRKKDADNEKRAITQRSGNHCGSCRVGYSAERSDRNFRARERIERSVIIDDE